MSLGQALLRGGAAGASSSGINYLSDALDTRKIREDALRRMAQGSVSPYARRSDPSGLCSVPDPFAGGVGYPAVRGYRYEGHPAAGTAGKGGFNLADFGKELLTGFVAGGLSSAAFYGAGKAVEAVKGSVRDVRISDSKTKKLYHYTNEKGMIGIVESKRLNPSLRSSNPKDARYGNGQYLSDIEPNTQTPVKLAKKFINVPNKYKYTHYVEIDVTDLNVIQGREGVFVIPNDSPLDLTDRIVSTGSVGTQ